MWSVVRQSKSVDDNSDIFPTPVFMLHSEGLKVNLLPVLEHNNPVTPVWCFVSTLVPLKLFLNCSRIIIQHCCVGLHLLCRLVSRRGWSAGTPDNKKENDYLGWAPPLSICSPGGSSSLAEVSQRELFPWVGWQKGQRLNPHRWLSETSLKRYMKALNQHYRDYCFYHTRPGAQRVLQCQLSTTGGHSRLG